MTCWGAKEIAARGSPSAKQASGQASAVTSGLMISGGIISRASQRLNGENRKGEYV